MSAIEHTEMFLDKAHAALKVHGEAAEMVIVLGTLLTIAELEEVLELAKRTDKAEIESTALKAQLAAAQPAVDAMRMLRELGKDGEVTFSFSEEVLANDWLGSFENSYTGRRYSTQVPLIEEAIAALYATLKGDAE